MAKLLRSQYVVVATPFQQVANRTANNKARLDAVVPYSAAGYTPALPAGVSTYITLPSMSCKRASSV